MKGIDFSNIGLGMENSPSFAKQLQEGLFERINAALLGLTNNRSGITIVSGCVMTVVGNQYNQTAGVVFYNGELLAVDAFAGNHATQVPVYQSVSQIATGQAYYGDAALRDTFYVRKLTMAMATSGSGIENWNSANVIRVENLKANSSDVSTLQTNLQNQITTLQNSKADKAQPAWIDIVLNSDWEKTVFGQTPQWRVDQFGKIELRGEVRTKTATASSIFISPAIAGRALAANRSVIFLKPYTAFGGGGLLGNAAITLESNGSITIGKSPFPNWSGATISVDNLSLEGIVAWP